MIGTQRKRLLASKKEPYLTTPVSQIPWSEVEQM